MPYGVTPDGFVRKTEANIRSDMQAKLRTRISPHLQFRGRNFLGNLVDVVAQELALPWEALEQAYNGFDPDNSVDDQVVSLALLNGVPRGGATKGLVSVLVTVEAGFSATAGLMIAHVEDDPENRWLNRDDFTAPGAGTHEIVFESETAISTAVAPSGTLTVIAGSLTGWVSITNPDDATPGTDIQDIEILRLRREQAIAAAASTTVPGIKKDVADVANVIQVVPFVDTTLHTVRVVVWDGPVPAADDDAIAQQMLDEGIAAGMTTIGAESGTASDIDGNEYTMFFDRAEQQRVYVIANVSAPDGASAELIREGIIAAMPISMGKQVNYSRLSAAPLDEDGVDGVVSFFIGLTASPVGTSNLNMDPDQFATLDSDDIVVNFV